MMGITKINTDAWVAVQVPGMVSVTKMNTDVCVLGCKCQVW